MSFYQRPFNVEQLDIINVLTLQLIQFQSLQREHMADAKSEELPIIISEQATTKVQTKSLNLQMKPSQQIQVVAPQGYKFIKTIGDGSFGKVKLGIHTMTDEKVAIKILCKERIRERTDIERISRQIKIMKLVRHPFIVQMYEIIESPKYLFLVMEYIEAGDLFDQISHSSKLPEDRCKKIFSQIILGLEYLHGIGITHRDMKPENILIQSNGVIKIADFGLGNFFTGEQKLKTACGSPCYAPPQMLNQQDYNPRKVDIWSSGIILYAMVHGYLPFEDDVTSLLYEKIKTKNVRVASWVSIPCRNLLRGLLAKSQNERWDVDTIKKHEFLYEQVQKQQKFVSKEIQDINTEEFHSICDHLGVMQEQRLLGNLKKNKHNNLTTLYYLGKKKYIRQKDFIQETLKQSSLKESIITQPLPELLNKNQQQNRNLYSFFQKDEPYPIQKQEIIHPKKTQIQHHEEHAEKQKIEVQQQSQFIPQLVSEQSNKSKAEDLRQSIIQPRSPPQEIIQTPKLSETPIESLSSSLKEKKQVPDFATKDIKAQKQPTKSFHAPATKKPPFGPAQTFKKVEKHEKKQDKQNKIENKGLKKSERMTIYQPKQEASKSEAEVKLYQRSHSKDRPIILKNNLKTQPSTHKSNETGTVTGKSVHVQPHLLDADRIVLCSGEKLCEILEKKGLNGRIQYFSYQKQAIFLAKCQLKVNKNSKGIPSIQKIISEINQAY